MMKRRNRRGSMHLSRQATVGLRIARMKRASYNLPPLKNVSTVLLSHQRRNFDVGKIVEQEMERRFKQSPHNAIQHYKIDTDSLKSGSNKKKRKFRSIANPKDY